MQWSDFFSAIALLFILEGILPFASPNRAREMLVRVAKFGNAMIRLMGIISMALGLIILYFAR